jgi:hypothetical protein
MKIRTIIFTLILLSVTIAAKKVKKETFSQEKYGIENKGTTLKIWFEKGTEHNHPLFAFWLADEKGNYIQTLYVAKSIGKGVFEHENRNNGSWLPGEIQRPAALPYWTFQRSILNERGTYLPTPSKPIADAYTGATPQNSFELTVTTEQPLNGKYKIYMEINQSWDWNEYWYNNKYPNDKEYKTSCQPALIYSANIDTESSYPMIFKPIGHSHYAGTDGSIDTDLTTITTALKIVKKVTVQIQK